MKPILSVFFYFFLTCFGVLGQTPSTGFLPNITPVSPEATAMNKFISYPVNLFSGVPSISVPIYTIDVNGMKVPISLDYHASGIKVSEVATWAGLGWNLSAGGAITRMVMGRPDEINGYLNGPAIKTTGIDPFLQDRNYLNLLYNNKIDGEPDIFSYSVPGKSGKFYYANQSINDVRIIPYNPLKITGQLNGSSLSFQILDEGGIEYRFGAVTEVTLRSTEILPYTSSWLLTEMVSTDKSDTIKFSYLGEPYQNPGELMDFTSVTDLINNDPAPNSPYFNRFQFGMQSSTSQQGSTTSTFKLSEIKFRNGKIVFTHSAANRTDIPNKALSKIGIYQQDALLGAYQLIQSVKLDQSYFFNNDATINKYRLRLDAVKIQDKNDQTVQTYGFGYRTDILLPDYVSSRAKDFWGYFNNKNNASLVPWREVQQETWAGGLYAIQTIGGLQNGREPDPAFNQAYTLNKLIFPTGGYSEFEYETNKYFDVSANAVKYAGGLRIKEIRHFPEIGSVPIKKTYKYGIDEDGLGKQIIPLETRFFFTDQKRYASYDNMASCRVRNYVSVPSVSVEPFDGTPVGYETVTEYIGEANNNIGKTEYKFSFYTDAFTSTYGINKPNIVSNHFRRGHLLNKWESKNNGDGSYKLVKHTENRYGAFPDNSTGAINIVVFEKNIYDNYSELATQSPYTWNSYSIMEGDDKITKTIETVYSQLDNSSLTTTSDYFYDNFDHQQVTRSVQTTTNGGILASNYKYPHDFTAQPVYNKMVAAHIINPVIEKSEFKDDFQRNFVRNNYKEWSTNYLLPETIEQQIGSNPIEAKARFYGYGTKSTILQMSKTNDVISSFIWGYNKKYPVAQAINAQNTEIFHSNFEEGGWEGTPESINYQAMTGYDNTRSHTGKYSGKIINTNSGEYTCHSNTWLNISLSAPKKFKYSGWIYSTGPSADIFLFMRRASETGYFTYVNAISTNVTNKWVYIEGEYLVPADITKLNIRLDCNSAGTVWYDDIKIWPADSQISTYTYDPLIGMTSKTDPNNKVYYYEYDYFGRLKLERDQFGNIIKTYQYNYRD